MVVTSFPAGGVLFRAGDPADGVVVVLEGTVDVRSPGGMLLGTAQPGSMVGEVGFLLGQARAATASAGADGVTVGLLPTRAVTDLLVDHPSLGVELSRELSRKLVAGNPAAQPTKVVVASGDVRLLLARLAGADAGRIGYCLLGDAEAPRRHPRLIPVTADDVRAHLRSRDERLQDCAVLVLAAGRKRHVLADAVTPVADFVLASGRTPQWLSSLTTKRILSIDGDELARTVRWVTGRAVAVVLSSGGSKTCAHIGVVEALEEAGVPIDAIAGCSGGAAIGAGFLAFADADEVAVRAKELGAVLSGGRFDVALMPRTAQAKGLKVRETFEEWGEGLTFADLPIPAAVVATDLGSGEGVVLTEGSFADAVRASMSIPGLLAPWRIGDRWFVDGAVVDPLPVTAARDLGVGVVIASTVAGRGNRAGGPAAVPVSADRAPGVLQVISSVITAGEAARVAASLPQADHVIAPEVDAAGSFDFSDVDGMRAAGRAAAEVVLAAGDLSSLVGDAG